MTVCRFKGETAAKVRDLYQQLLVCSFSIWVSPQSIDALTYLRSEVYHREANPAPNNPDRRVRTGEHQRQELVTLPEHYLVYQRAVRDEWYADCDVKRITSVEKEEPGPARSRRKTIEDHEKQDKPEYCVDRLDRKFCWREEQWEQRHVSCHSKWPESAKVSSVL